MDLCTKCFQGRVPDVTLGCIHYLQQHFPHARVSVEVEKPGRDGLQELAVEADVVFYSKGWALVRILSRLQSRTLLIR